MNVTKVAATGANSHLILFVVNPISEDDGIHVVVAPYITTCTDRQEEITNQILVLFLASERSNLHHVNNALVC